MDDRARVEREISGALKSTIIAHGAITIELRSSASKRIYAALKSLRRQARQQLDYEYGVSLRSRMDAPHRWGMTEEDARTWIEECQEMGFSDDAFVIIRRPLGRWESEDGIPIRWHPRA